MILRTDVDNCHKQMTATRVVLLGTYPHHKSTYFNYLNKTY
jgi:hypothetical protein